ncbi:hypothetical protein ABGB19_06465 [Mycobacterium sp. B14F4]|uniref:hypothetical protein n=1 Tax=Mycobacterium sp. B14F4 TaxID=3153565 RepID=UPI00325D8D0F
MAERRDDRPESVNDVFGETLPRVSADERDPRSPDDDVEHDQWLRDNRPPHHV